MPAQPEHSDHGVVGPQLARSHSTPHHPESKAMLEHILNALGIVAAAWQGVLLAPAPHVQAGQALLSSQATRVSHSGGSKAAGQASAHR